MKRCPRCGKIKENSDFNKCRRNKDGLQDNCKECRKERYEEGKERVAEQQKKYYEENRERIAKRVKTYRKSEQGKKLHCERALRQRIKHPDRHSARRAVSHALTANTIVKRPCEICGSTNVQAHHEDYDKPLDVIWLCPKHHRWIHS